MMMFSDCPRSLLAVRHDNKRGEEKMREIEVGDALRPGRFIYSKGDAGCSKISLSTCTRVGMIIMDIQSDECAENKFSPIERGRSVH